MDEFLEFLYKWQTLFSGLIAFLGGSFAILAVFMSNNHQQKLIKIQKEQTEDAFSLYFVNEIDMTTNSILLFMEWIQRQIESPNHIYEKPPQSNLVIGEGLVNVWNLFDKGNSQVLIQVVEFSHSCFRAQIAIRDAISIINHPKTEEGVDVMRSTHETCRESVVLGAQILKHLQETLEVTGHENRPKA
ncbi:MAG: hypothetical protein JXR18_12545 [Neptuniibacter sp.]